jgi:hypothetical protein
LNLLAGQTTTINVRPSLVVVFGWPHRAGDDRMGAVGADDDPRALIDASAGPATPPDAGHTIIRPDQLVDGEFLSHLSTCRRGRIHEQLVEHRPARAETTASSVRAGDGAGQRKRSDVEGHVQRDRRAVRRRDAVEQSPAVQDLRPVRPDDVRRNGVARKTGLVDEQDAVAFAREQQCGGRAGAARADDDGVVHGPSLYQMLTAAA